jgi:hypothetical protein
MGDHVLATAIPEGGEWAFYRISLADESGVLIADPPAGDALDHNVHFGERHIHWSTPRAVYRVDHTAVAP